MLLSHPSLFVFTYPPRSLCLTHLTCLKARNCPLQVPPRHLDAPPLKLYLSLSTKPRNLETTTPLQRPSLLTSGSVQLHRFPTVLQLHTRYHGPRVAKTGARMSVSMTYLETKELLSSPHMESSTLHAGRTYPPTTAAGSMMVSSTNTPKSATSKPSISGEGKKRASQTTWKKFTREAIVGPFQKSFGHLKKGCPLVKYSTLLSPSTSFPVPFTFDRPFPYQLSFK
ncbi:hypothetical protein CPB84DRAFT_1786376 [Gymnopilus junonius]|uniref:Uncharacterized protein n=1 Tax=Gymnopilus junonius TaxID=109634 RepID=A0A9P5NFT5_GYMJU|nr:hypothetical protein CPB84DRAFT_1786376 [Gymnopilus junonius]